MNTIKSPTPDEQALINKGFVPSIGANGKTIWSKSDRLAQPVAVVHVAEAVQDIDNPLIYKGVKMKSKSEVKLARYFDSIDETWEYEPVTFKLLDGSGERYTPDFRLGKSGVFYEHKPYNWTPKEGRLGISKMKRGASRIKEVTGKSLIKASCGKGVWHFDTIPVAS